MRPPLRQLGLDDASGDRFAVRLVEDSQCEDLGDGFTPQLRVGAPGHSEQVCTESVAIGATASAGRPQQYQRSPTAATITNALTCGYFSSQRGQTARIKYYRYCTYIYIPFQYTSVILGAYLFTASDLSWLGFDGGLSWPAKIGLALSVGMLGGVGINTAHEMGHKKDELERWLSKITLAQTFYGHFYIEHNRGHHVRVATPEDPASARFGETFWEFLPRSVWGSLKSSWGLEAARLRRAGKSPWHWSNDVLNASVMSVVFYGILIAVFGVALIPYIVISAVFGFTLLETVNYLEHYGLLRQKLESGRYERCAPEHSWNSDHIVTNLFLYHLQRHSDHHANPTRRYQTLRSMEGAPNLPSGYASMIALTYFPPLWRRVMDHRVLEHYDGDITRVNVHPRLRDKMLARYGVAA